MACRLGQVQWRILLTLAAVFLLGYLIPGFWHRGPWVADNRTEPRRMLTGLSLTAGKTYYDHPEAIPASLSVTKVTDVAKETMVANQELVWRGYTPQVGKQRAARYFLEYSFTDPSVYKGPIVEGWPPGKDRNMSIYMRPGEDTLLNDISCLKIPKDLAVLVIIQSDPSKFNRRQADRETWMRLQEKYPHIKVLFLFGKNENQGVIPEKQLQIEQERYCDLLQFDFVDSYTNQTLDTTSALKFVLGHKVSTDFLLIGDDDSYINIPALWHKLYRQNTIARNSSYLLGFTFHRPRVFREKKNTGVKFVGRVRTPEYIFNREIYPDALGGGAYILPRTTLECLYEESMELPLFHINDIFLTAFVAERCGYQRKRDWDFHPMDLDPKDVKLSDVSFHWSKGWRKAVYYDILEKQNGVLDECRPDWYCLEAGVLLYCDHVECRKARTA